MKKLKFIAALAIALTLVPFLQSCLDDDDTEYPWLAMSTIKTLEGVGQGYYFGLDDGSKMYPGDTAAIHNYTPIDGQRAFIYFNYLDESKVGYDHNVQVEQIINILTKDIIELNAENAQAIGDNKINATSAWIAQNYLNIEYQYMGTGNIDKKHFLNLVVNTLATGKDEEGYISLEFRHNAEGDAPERIREGYVSFKLGMIEEQMKEAKGLKIRVNSIYDGVKFRKVDFEKEKKTTFKQLNNSVHTAKTAY